MDQSPFDQSANPSTDHGLESLEVSSNSPITSADSQPTMPLTNLRRHRLRSRLTIASIFTLALLAVLTGLWLFGGFTKHQSPSSIESYQTTQGAITQPTTDTKLQTSSGRAVTINGDLVLNGKLTLSPEAISNLGGLVNDKVNLQQGVGTAQVGNIFINGTAIANIFQGSGANLSNLNASNITTGTLNSARLDADVTRLGQTIPLNALQSTVLTSLNGLGGNKNADIVAGTGISINTNSLTNQIEVSTAGNITGVIAGTGLTGGGNSGNVTLNVDTGVVTVQGNTFNGASQLVQLNGAGELPTLSALNLTNLNASNIVTGTLGDNRLSGNVTLQGNTFNLPSKLVLLDSSGNLPALNGSALTSLNASNIASGTIADARLSANVALLNASQTFTGALTLTQPLTVNTIQPSSTMTIGSPNQSLTLQGDLTTKLTATSGGNTVSLGFTGTPTGNITYNLDTATTPGTYTLCTTVGNCANSGGGVTTLGGTTGKLARFTGGQSIGDSAITDTGSAVTVGATALFKAGADSTTALRVQNATGLTNVFTVDTANTRVAIGQATAGYPLDVAGDINSTTGLRVAGNLVCDATGCAASSGSGFYIGNGISLQTGANFNIESANTSSVVGTLKGKSGQTADLLQAKNGSGSTVASIDKDGNINTTGQYRVNGTQISSSNLANDSNLAKLSANQAFSGANTFTGATKIQPATDSTSAFQVQNSAGTSNLLMADTTNTRLGIGTATPGYTLDVNGDVNIASGSSYRINGVAICGPTATCAPSSGSGSYIQNSIALQTGANINIQSSSASSVVAIFKGVSGQTADLMQARDSSNTVLAKITASGQIFQGANQVCDASNNCGYALGSGSGNYIQNGVGTQVANFNIQSASAGSVGAVIQGASGQTADTFQVRNSASANMLSVGATGNVLFKNSTDSTSALQVQNAAGTNLFTVDTVNNKVIVGSGIQNLTHIGMGVITLTTSGYSPEIRGSTNASGSGFVGVELGYTGYGYPLWAGAYGAGAISKNAGTTAFTVQGASGQTADTFQVRNSAAANMLSVGATGNVLFKNSTDSTSAFQVQDASGTNLLIADTVNKRICISTCASMSQSIKLESDGITFGHLGGNVTAKITQQGNGPLLIGAGSSGNFNGVSIAGAGVGASLTVRGSAITPTDILRIQASSGNDVLNINTTGAVLAKNSANSTAAFQIQNASGARVLNVNTNVNPSPNAWLATTSLPATRESHGSVAYNGYLYAVGGYSGGILGDVQFAPINNNSTIGSWSATSGLSARYSHQTVAYNGYMYALGGYNGGSLSSVQYSAIGGNGTLGSWSNTTGLTVSRYALSAVAYNGYMYALGGVNGTTPQSGVQYAPINANGTLGSWTNTTAMPTTRSGAATVIANGYIYMVGGTGDPTSVIYAPINSDGSLGVWTSTTALPSARQSVSAVVNNNSLYVMGGYDTSNNTTNSVVSIPLNMDGTLGTSWTIRPNISSARAYAGSAAYKGTIYLTGGNGTYNSTQPKSDVQYLPLGTFLYDNSITLNGLLSNTGPAQFRNDTDSTTAFAIQNATATSIFQVDTQNSRVGVGNASPGNLLSVGALTTADSAGQLAVGTGGTSNKGIVIQGVSGQTADLLQAQDSTGAVLAKIDNVGNLTVKSITLAGHIISGGGTPTIAGNAGAGTSPTINVSGTDTSGTITLTTGTGVASSADVLTLTFATAFAQAPNVVFSPANAGAAALSGNSAVFVTAGTGNFKFSVGSAGLVDSTQYKWTYHVIQ